MKNTGKTFICFSACLLFFAGFINAQGASEGSIQSPDEKTVQIVTSCDGRKKVIVEGCREGEPMPEHKARKTAQLLMSLMEFCEEEITVKLPETEAVVHLSINGMPYFSVRDIGELPLQMVHGGEPHTEREKRVWAAEMQRIISNGYDLFHDPTLGTNGISCDMCHPDAANTHPETYPKFQTQINKVSLLRDMINWCIENPLEGERLPDDDPRMKALESYIISTRAGKELDPGKH